MLTGMFVLLCSEYLIPMLTSGEKSSYILDILSILFPFIIGGILLGLFFVNPLVYMILLIRKLTSRDYILSDMDNRFYKQSGKLKVQYFLYQKLISDISNNPKAVEYDFSFQSNADVIQVNADEKLLYRAIQNVVMNAILHN
nr:hypothetical protein NZ312_17085 [Clostridioides difficile]